MNCQSDIRGVIVKRLDSENEVVSLESFTMDKIQNFDIDTMQQKLADLGLQQHILEKCVRFCMELTGAVFTTNETISHNVLQVNVKETTREEFCDQFPTDTYRQLIDFIADPEARHALDAVSNVIFSQKSNLGTAIYTTRFNMPFNGLIQCQPDDVISVPIPKANSDAKVLTQQEEHFVEIIVKFLGLFHNVDINTSNITVSSKTIDYYEIFKFVRDYFAIFASDCKLYDEFKIFAEKLGTEGQNILQLVQYVVDAIVANKIDFTDIDSINFNFIS